MIHAPAPWCQTGYAKQAGKLAKALRLLGHETAISAHYGLQGGMVGWDGIPVYPGGDMAWGEDVIGHRVRHFGAGLVIVLADLWIMNPGPFRELTRSGVPLAAWVPVDTRELSTGDQGWLEATGARPVAMSRHGEAAMRKAGLDPLYAPHTVDTTVYRPGEREAGPFTAGICAANNDHDRKGYPEMFRAFAKLLERDPGAVLQVHARAANQHARGLNLYQLAGACGIAESVQFVEQESYQAGMIGDEAMAGWYGGLDVLLNCSWGEGFGIPVIEAQACGVPVIVTRASAMTELCGAGWLVDGEDKWNPVHGSWWVKPSITQITAALRRAHDGAGKLRGRAREFALAYDDTAIGDYWAPVIAALTETTA